MDEENQERDVEKLSEIRESIYEAIEALSGFWHEVLSAMDDDDPDKLLWEKQRTQDFDTVALWALNRNGLTLDD